MEAPAWAAINESIIGIEVSSGSLGMHYQLERDCSFRQKKKGGEIQDLCLTWRW